MEAARLLKIPPRARVNTVVCGSESARRRVEAAVGGRPRGRVCGGVTYIGGGSPSQMKPCWMRPQSMSLQWWQYVGLWKVFLQKLCPCAAGGCSVEPATDAMSPSHRSRQIFTVNSH